MHLFITGTDTGVGKTFITYNLAIALRERGVSVACYKPVETGVQDLPSDGSLLAKATAQPLEEVVPITFRLPLAPYAASIEKGVPLDISSIKEFFFRLKRKYELILVEGAGGIAVPILKDYDYSDLAKDLDLKVVIVARAGLGTINHTYLTYRYAKSKGLQVAGIVLNGFRGEDVSERTNPRIVEELTGIRPVEIPFSQGETLAQEYLDRLLSLVGL